MIFSGDPYRTLGLSPGASLAEVKRAYRRLAKQYHPDTAGPAALPRFLAIKAAYEMLAGASRGRPATRPASRPTSRPTSRPGWRPPSGFGAGTARPAAGDRGPDPGATSPGAEEHAPGSPRGTDRDPFAWARQGPPPRDQRRRETNPPPGQDARAGHRRRESSGDGPTDPGRKPGAGSRQGRAPTRRATLGSTSYDDALHDDDRVWHGAAWYGVTTGTYWRPNPREYADPRKHGPEYEERARRAERTWGARSGAGAGAREDAAPDGPAAQPSDRSGSTSDRPGARTRLADGPTTSPESDRAFDAAWSWSIGEAGRDRGGPILERLADRIVGVLLGTPSRARVSLAVAGWPLLALLLVGALGELTGCGRYAAACPVAGETWTAAAQLGGSALFALLLAVPRLALRATIAGFVALVVAAPAAALLAVFGGSRDPAGASGALTLVVALAWSAGAIGAASGRLRLPPTVQARVPWWS